jgi:hypothetical protein
MTVDERLLQLLLRVVGTAGLLAIPFVLVPHDWLDAIHKGLGMGEFPDTAVTGYLARTTSALHAVIGGLLWTISFDLPRHRRVLTYLGTAFVLYGAAMLAVNLAQAMPLWWICAEGPFNLAFGSALLWQSWFSQKEALEEAARQRRVV